VLGTAGNPPLGGYAWEQITRAGTRASSNIWLMFDYDTFHDLPGALHSRNYLYLDGHVD
jgi:prepilin-type processing-associated H-X9-DG protein